MAIRRIAPIKKKKSLSISSTGNLIVSTSRKDEDKKDPRVFIASSSPSVPVTEIRLRNLSQDKKEEWDILFNQDINPINFIRTFQDVVTSNLLLIPDVPKEQVLSQIDQFIDSTSGVVIQAIEQQKQYFTEAQKELQSILEKEKEIASQKKVEEKKKEEPISRDPKELASLGYKQVGPTTFVDSAGNTVEI